MILFWETNWNNCIFTTNPKWSDKQTGVWPMYVEESSWLWCSLGLLVFLQDIPHKGQREVAPPVSNAPCSSLDQKVAPMDHSQAIYHHLGCFKFQETKDEKMKSEKTRTLDILDLLRASYFEKMFIWNWDSQRRSSGLELGNSNRLPPVLGSLRRMHK